MIAAIIQARMSSSRLPGKVLLPLAGRPVLQHVIERARRAQKIDKVVIATTVEKEDDAIVKVCEKNGYDFFRGSQDDVLYRYFEAARQYGADAIVRLTCDNPLVDPDGIDEVIFAYRKGAYDYVSNIFPEERTFSRGLDCEVFSFNALKKANAHAREPYEREHVTPYIHENKTGEFRIGPMIKARGIYARPQYRLALDYPEDYALLSMLYDQFYKPDAIISVPEVMAYLDEHPEVAAINAAREKEYPRQGMRK